MKTVLLLCALVAGSSSVWADSYTLQLSSSKKISTSGLTDGSVVWAVTNNSASIGNNWINDYSGEQFGTGSTQGNVVLSTSSITGTITQVDVYSQTGTNGGATVAVSVGGTSWGSQNMKVPSATRETPGQLTFSGSKSGAIQITLTQTKQKAMYLNKIVITYTPSSTPSSGASFATENPSIDWPTSLTYTQTATTASGYSSTAGASVTYSIGSTNTCGATINASTGEVTPTKGGSVQVVATAAAIDGKFTQSTASYTLTVNDVRPAATLSWSENSVEIFKDAVSYTLPTLNNPNSLELTYTVEGTAGLASVTPAGVVTVNTSTVGTATVKAIFAGNNSYKAKTVSYTINVVDPTVKGSKYNPYTVAEVISAAPSSTSTPASGQGDVYVIGYIVGCYNSSSKFTTTSSEFQASNIALADDPSNTLSTIPVQMPSSGAIRTGFNVVDNPVHIGSTQVLLKGDILKYFGKPGVKNVDEMTAVAVNVTIATSGYSTLAKAFGLDFSSATPVGLVAYVASEISASAVTLDAIDEAPASTGVILKGTAGQTYSIPVKNDASFDGTNKLKAAVTATTIAANEAYIMQGGLFHKVTAASSIPAGKAYLLTSDVPAAARELSFVFGGDETTGISTMHNSQCIMHNEYFDLQGRRVVDPTRGLYIVNGKKVVIK